MTHTPSISLLKLTAGWIASPAPIPAENPGPKPFHETCQLCSSIFLGDTAAEAEIRKAQHRCSRSRTRFPVS